MSRNLPQPGCPATIESVSNVRPARADGTEASQRTRRKKLSPSNGRRPVDESMDEVGYEASLGERIYQVLVDWIIEGRIGYGEKLSLRELAATLGVSTMPVREAVRRLAVEDVVAIKPRSNCYVKLPTRSSMLEAFEIREVLEIHAVKTTYSTVPTERLSDLRRYLEHMDRTLPSCSKDSRMREYVRWDQLFHQELCVLSNNASLLRIYRINMLHLNIALTFQAGVEPQMDRVHEDHRLIYQALTRNSREALGALRRHLTRCRRNMVRGDLFRALP